MDRNPDSEQHYASHSLRRKPMGDLTTDDLRHLIRQGVGITHLLPLALDDLRDDPLAAGQVSGDLLAAVLAIDSSFWSKHATLHLAVQDLLATIDPVPESLAGVIEQFNQQMI